MTPKGHGPKHIGIIGLARLLNDCCLSIIINLAQTSPEAPAVQSSLHSSVFLRRNNPHVCFFHAHFHVLILSRSVGVGVVLFRRGCRFLHRWPLASLLAIAHCEEADSYHQPVQIVRDD